MKTSLRGLLQYNSPSSSCCTSQRDVGLYVRSGACAGGIRRRIPVQEEFGECVSPKCVETPNGFGIADHLCSRPSPLLGLRPEAIEIKRKPCAGMKCWAGRWLCIRRSLRACLVLIPRDLHRTTLHCFRDPINSIFNAVSQDRWEYRSDLGLAFWQRRHPDSALRRRGLVALIRAAWV